MLKINSALISVALVMQLATEPTSASDTVEIFRSDGAKQCYQNSGRPLSRDVKLLQQAGVSKIFHSEKRSVPGIVVVTVCGASSGMANVFVISVGDWNKHGESLSTGSLGFALWPGDKGR